MRAFKIIQKAAPKILLTLTAILLTVYQSLAQNIFDSDLSNSAGTNKNWHNSFWFFGCVTFLLVVAYIGWKRKYNKIRRD